MFKSLKFLTAEYTPGLFKHYDYHINLVIFLDIDSRCLITVMLLSNFIKLNTPENMIDYSNTKYPMILFINVSYPLHMCHNLFRHWQPTYEELAKWFFSSVRNHYSLSITQLCAKGKCGVFQTWAETAFSSDSSSHRTSSRMSGGSSKLAPSLWANVCPKKPPGTVLTLLGREKVC